MTSRKHTAQRARERLGALSRTAYTAAAGHLETDPEPVPQEPARRRWAVAPRLAKAAVAVVAVLALASGIRALAGADPEPADGGTVPGAVADGPAWATAGDALGGDPSAPGAPGGSGARAGQDGASSPAEDTISAAAEEDDADPGPASGSTGPPAGADRGVVVHVAGQVVEPGVRELRSGSRVHEALAAAGGATPEADLAAVNLARPLVDGEQVYVPAHGEAVPSAAPTGSEQAGETRVNLNTASVEELDTLPGIGPVLAARIVDWRQENGRFTLVDELGEVSGIGPAVLGRLRDRVVV